MEKLPISVIIITLNEADRIEAAIRSVIDWVDEVVLIDSGSQDNTVELAAQSGARVMFNAWPGYGQQKRFAEEQARNDWLLNLDADERITEPLRHEIAEHFTQPQMLADGYQIAIHDIIYPTEELNPNTPYKPVRLYRKSKGRYSESPVHDRVIMQPDTQIEKLRGKIAHESIRSFSHRVEKMNAYSDAQVQDMVAKGRKPSVARILLEFWLSFIKRYFFKGYWRKGLIGYVYAVNYAYSRFLRQIKLYEYYKRKSK